MTCRAPLPAPDSPVKVLLAAAVLLLAGAPRLAQGQLADLVSPGPLSKAHASLEGVKACVKCHEPGKGVAAAKCLACHRPVAERIAAKKGVHREVTDDCVACHVEHAGVNAELRPFETKGFDHADETGFPLEGLHAPLGARCAACHKGRSFLTASPACASCHADVHKGQLGADCTRCHSTSVAFRQAKSGFDHGKTAFALTGAHATVDCGKCHKGGAYKGVAFATCESCHADAHRKAFGADCAACHQTQSWKTTKVDHGRTRFPLAGRHATTPCERCHASPPLKAKLSFGTCASCHRDPHRGTFTQDCASCHDPKGWKGAPFDHARRTRFPLTERHAEVPCASCHKPKGPSAAVPAGKPPASGDLEFKGLSPACSSCHADVHKGKLGADCQSCHQTRSFRVPSFDHAKDEGFYGGGHGRVACERCHAPRPAAGARAPVGSWTFAGLAKDCKGCHQDPHLGQLKGTCESCHTVAGKKFAPEGFRHETARFPLTGAHAKLACAQCHRKESGAFPSGTGTAVRLTGLKTACQGCHKDPHLGQLNGTCESCHTTSGFQLATYRHRFRADFFAGKHATTKCQACHKKEERAYPAGRGTAVRFTGLGATCASCHADVHEGSMGPSCESCHSVTHAFRTPSVAFHKVGTFPLDGRHLQVPCAGCHQGRVFKGTPNRCYDCHWLRRQDDRFQTRLGTDCESCHRTAGWTPVSWSHESATGLALSGAHRTVDCEKCHAGGVFARAGNSGCVSCHEADFRRAREPDHTAAGFPTACETCHRASDGSWDLARFDHASFPLTGAHAARECASCHRNNVYWGTPTDCVGCHRTDYDRTASPNHLAAGFPTTCQTCHRAADASWRQGSAAHSTWPLQGRHAAQACASCHRNNVYRGTPTDCVGCHQASYNQAANPNHLTAGFPTACATCHRVTDASWGQGTFNHSTWALQGRHSAQACASCHRNGVYRGTPTDCVGCHQASYNQAANPNHLTAGFPTACATCHRVTDTSWSQGTFTHSTWALQGRHAAQACASCHRDGVYRGTPTDCVGCHQASYNQAANPNHLAAGFPTACATCHRVTDTSWSQGTFTHSTWALQGRHAAQACASCHRNSVYRGTPRECAGCHIAKYNQTTNPNHAAAGFPTNCEVCHRATDSSWSQGTFNHARWPLVGSHTGQPCARCHVGGVYQGTSTQCVACHRSDYDGTRNPNHATAGFPTACEPCHRVADTSWSQGTFNHTWFPITTGKHAGNPCSACHNVPTNFRLFTCLTCHDRARTDEKHRGVNGYRYESTACYACHPNGRGD